MVTTRPGLGLYIFGLAEDLWFSVYRSTHKLCSWLGQGPGLVFAATGTMV
jgi:hypothetical protein